MKEFKEQIVSRMIEKSQEMRIVSLRETAAELGINHIAAQDVRDVAQRISQVEGFHLVQMQNTPNDSMFCSLCLVEDDVEFDDGEEFADEQKFIVVDEDGGDRWTEVYDTAEAANAAAQAVWQHLTEREQRRRHIWAGVVTRDDLDDDAVDEETGAIDWSAWVSANTFPCAFDSSKICEVDVNE